MFRKVVIIAVLGLLPGFLKATAAPSKELTAFEVNKRLSPGINYGNVLEADPPEGWGLKVDENDFKIITDADFKSVRIPVRWSAKAGNQAPYTIDPAFFTLVDRAVQAGLDNHLYVIVNMHHYLALFDNPDQHKERFLALWKQIAEHYRQYPSNLILEIMNEPNKNLTTQLWNQMFPEALKVIRQSNPARLVLITGANWGGAGGLVDLIPPRGDDRLIFTFHCYTPMKFTHQGASWVGKDSKNWLGTKWTGTRAEIEEVKKDFEFAAYFQKKFKVPVYLGEFGAYREADEKSRETWDANMVKMAQTYGFSYAYWNFKDEGFAAYDTKAGKWNEGIKAALLQVKK